MSDQSEQYDAGFSATEDVQSGTAGPRRTIGGAHTAAAPRRVRRPRRPTVLLVAGAALILITGTGAGALTATALEGSTSTTAATSGGTGPGTGAATGGSGSARGGSGFGPGTAGGTSGTTSTAATASQQAGVVVIDTVLKYDGAEAAGTGIVLTSSGEILTNNHVVEGSTSITVTVETTGRTYTAKVVGTDATDDIAVLQLSGASGLTTATLASTATTAGEAVTAVGNAGGTGSLTQASGTVTGLAKQITTAAEGSAASENLTGLIETDAGIVSGDSGGPLLDSSGAVVGIDTAAGSDPAAADGYAIPIRTARTIAAAIVAGKASSTITIGYPAFLGVETSRDVASTAGAVIEAVLSGTPAAHAGLVAGDTVTAIDGTSVTSAASLSTVLAGHAVGDTVTVHYTTRSGASSTASVTLVSGPAA